MEASISFRHAFALSHQPHELTCEVAAAVPPHVLQHPFELTWQLAGQVSGLLLAEALAQDREHRLGGHLGAVPLQTGLLVNALQEVLVRYLAPLANLRRLARNRSVKVAARTSNEVMAVSTGQVASTNTAE